MKLHSIRLKHFRQFYGDQSITIAAPGDKNITLVHAENGVGKTTLLNAVLWTFFGETTRRFEQKRNIVNFEALEQGDRTCSVELSFDHEGIEYRAVRAVTLTLGEYSKARFDVMRVEKNGSLSAPLLNPESFVNTVIPHAMAPYFFFDGEQAETFSSETNYKAVAEAIRDILGCKTIETAIEDLRHVGKTFNKELGQVRGEDEIKRLEDRIDFLEQAIDVRKQRIRDLDTDIAASKTQMAVILEQLRGAQEAAELQIEREAKQRELHAVEGQIDEAESEILRWIDRKSIAAVSEKLTSESLNFIDDASLRGKIPSPYNEEFVKGLLQAELCVCDRPIHPGTPEWRSVQALLKTAGNAEVMSRIVRARGRIEVLKESRSDAARLLEHEEKKLAALTANRRKLEQSINELGKKIGDLPIVEIQQREQARRDLEKRLDSARVDLTRNQVENERDQDEIKRLNDQVAELALQNIQARRLVIRRDLANKAGDFLEAVLRTYESKAREDIQRTVNEILEATARRHYRLVIDESFELKLMFADGRATPKSGGENQLMSLAFIAALVQFAERRSKEHENDLFIPATVAPLILDSPFGQLDDRYRVDTAAFVPRMAPQVVLLVSSSQGKQEVIEALGDRIGAEYTLIAENRGQKGDKKQDFITVQGRRIATTLFNCTHDMTRIEQIG
jgi:DNA sulfur modification protein DndD